MKKPRQEKRRHIVVEMEPALWHLLGKLQAIINEQLKETGRPGISPSGVITVVLKNALLENAGDIQGEYEALGLHRLAVQLAPVLGADGLAACGLADLSYGEAAPREEGSRALI